MVIQLFLEVDKFFTVGLDHNLSGNFKEPYTRSLRDFISRSFSYQACCNNTTSPYETFRTTLQQKN